MIDETNEPEVPQEEDLQVSQEGAGPTFVELTEEQLEANNGITISIAYEETYRQRIQLATSNIQLYNALADVDDDAGAKLASWKAYYKLLKAQSTDFEAAYAIPLPSDP